MTTNRNKQLNRARRAVIIMVILTALVVFFSIFSKLRPAFLFPKWKDYKVYGVDVSRHQGDIDWYQLKSHEVKFAFIKATEGEKLIDKQFEENWSMAKEVGIARGAYHFYRPKLDWKIQARNFINNVELEKGDLPPVLDIELIHSKDQEYLVSEIKKYLEVLEKHYGMKPIVYTYENYYNRFLLDEFRGYNLWIAKYSNSAPALNDAAHWEFWQYSETGELIGISEKVDLNCFYGNKEQFQKILKK